MIFGRKKSPAAAEPTPVPLMTSAEPTPAIEVQEATGPRQTILVVDDDPVILKTLSFKLKSKGYHVVAVSDGSAAIGAMRDENPDLMLVDVCYPPDVASGGCVPWDGFLLTQWLRRFGGGNIPAIIISSEDRADYRARASAVGAAGFLRKPIDHDQLFAFIDLALGGKKDGDPDKPAAVLAN